MDRISTFREFYPYYLSEHRDSMCRRLHFVGTSLVLGLVAFTVVTGEWLWLLAVPLAGYSFAWVGHFFYEKNRPATFQYPLYSLAADFVMFRDMLTRRVPF